MARRYVKNQCLTPFFVTGTDTGVGKTAVASALALCLQEQGYSVVVMKPLATGGGENYPKSILKSDPVFCFRAPLSPYAASLLEKKTISAKKILGAYRALRKKYDVVIVEGIGGLLVPIKKNYFVADLAREMKLPLLIVARPGLGTLNHTLMTIKTAQSYKLPIAGIIFNHVQPSSDDVSEKTNAKILQKLTNVPVLGTLPYDPQTNMQKGFLGKKLQDAVKKLIIQA